MKKYIVIVVIILFMAGNIYQWLNPRVEIKEKIVEVEKVITKIKTKIKIVTVTAPDGTITRTETDDSTTETDSDIFRESDKQTKPKPIPLNSIYLGVNPSTTTELEIVYSRKVFGPISLYGSGLVDMVELKPSFHVGIGFQF